MKLSEAEYNAKRDAFAAAAMTGLLADQSIDPPPYEDISEWAEDIRRYAEGMMKSLGYEK